MLRTRVIPMLLLRGQGLVKTRRFKRPTYIGDPINVVKIFNEKEVDEIFIADMLASKEGRPPNFDLLEHIVSEAFMPVAYAGGVTSVEHAQRLLRLGIEKVGINTSALRDPSLVARLADRFGAQCVVASIDVERGWLGRHRVCSHSKVPISIEDPVELAQRLIEQGAGEVLITSVDRDGTMEGFDLDLLGKLRGRLSAPLIVAGGAGTVEHMIDAIRVGGASAIGVGARFVFYGPHRAVLVTYLDPNEMTRVQRG